MMINAKKILPLLADVIVKIESHEILTTQEGLVYLSYIKALPKEDSELILARFFKQYKVAE